MSNIRKARSSKSASRLADLQETRRKAGFLLSARISLRECLVSAAYAEAGAGGRARAGAGGAGGTGRGGEAQSLRCPPSLLRHVLRVSYRKGRCAAVYLFGLRPLHLCGTRLEGGHRRLFPSLRFVWVEPKQRCFGCWFVAVARRSTLARWSRSAARAGAAARKALTEPERPYQHARRNGPLGRPHPHQRLSFPLTVAS